MKKYDMTKKSSRTVLAERLKDLMSKRPDIESQNKLSKKAGLSQSTIGRILTSTNAPDLDVLDQLADACGMEAADLIGSGSKNTRLSASIKLLDEKELSELTLFIEFILKKRQNPQDTGADFDSTNEIADRLSAPVRRASTRGISSIESESAHERTHKRR